jgi:hypothetical protein
MLCRRWSLGWAAGSRAKSRVGKQLSRRCHVPSVGSHYRVGRFNHQAEARRVDRHRQLQKLPFIQAALDNIPAIVNSAARHPSTSLQSLQNASRKPKVIAFSHESDFPRHNASTTL